MFNWWLAIKRRWCAHVYREVRVYQEGQGVWLTRCLRCHAVLTKSVR